MKNICLLGATGSIGDSTIDVVNQHPKEFKIVALAAHSNWKKMAKIAKDHSVTNLCMWDETAAKELSKELNCKVLVGMEGLLELVSLKEVDVMLNALVGSVGCLPTIKAIENSKYIALANKETLVMGGPVIKQKLAEHPEVIITPIDSEHNAIFQSLAGRPVSEVENIQLTASGGPFREYPKEKFEDISLEQALNHPTWNMGPKVTLDSASLMNKGLEVIEAHFLFDVAYENIKVVVHPQSIIHSMVQFRDGSLIAQLGAPDMRIPIQNALTSPERLKLDTKRVSLPELAQLTFFDPDFDKFPCLKLAFEAGKQGGTMPAVLNAANEILVGAFLKKEIGFMDIPRGVENVLSSINNIKTPSLEDILDVDKHARALATELLKK